MLPLTPGITMAAEQIAPSTIISSTVPTFRLTVVRLSASITFSTTTTAKNSAKISTRPMLRKKLGNSVPTIMKDSDTMAATSTALLTVFTGMPWSVTHSTMPMGSAISV